MRFSLLNRKVHYWAAIAIALPFGAVLVTGILLQLKKQLPWVQPTERRTTTTAPSLSLPLVLEIARGVPEAGVKSWNDIHRIDVRPDRGLLKVITTSNWEIQLDPGSGAVLQTAYRRSDLIESIHDGSWIHPAVKLGVFLPTALVLVVMWATGLYLFALPIWSRRRKTAAVRGGLQAPKR